MFTQKELNIRQRRWLELFKDYDMTVLCHPGKANIVAEILRRMTMGSVSHLDESKIDIEKEVHRFTMLGVRLESFLDGCVIIHHNSESFLLLR